VITDEHDPSRITGTAATAVALGSLAVTYPLWQPVAMSIGRQAGRSVAQWPSQISQMWEKGLDKTPILPFTAAGTMLGLAFSRPEHRTHDMAVGAVAGTVAGVALKGAGMYQHHWGKAKLPFYAALYTGAVIAGAHFNQDAQEQAGVRNSNTGEVEHISPEESAQMNRRMNSGMHDRMRNINASGDMLFGMR